VIDANIDRVLKLEKIVNSQFEVGLAKKIDLDRVKVNNSNLKTQRQELLNSVSQQENLLKYYMGMPVTEQIAIPEASLKALEETVQRHISDGSFNLNNLNSYLVLKKQEELLNLQRKAFLAEFYPKLSLGANYM